MLSYDVPVVGPLLGLKDWCSEVSADAQVYVKKSFYDVFLFVKTNVKTNVTYCRSTTVIHILQVRNIGFDNLFTCSRGDGRLWRQKGVLLP